MRVALLSARRRSIHLLHDNVLLSSCYTEMSLLLMTSLHSCRQEFVASSENATGTVFARFSHTVKSKEQTSHVLLHFDSSSSPIDLKTNASPATVLCIPFHVYLGALVSSLCTYRLLHFSQKCQLSTQVIKRAIHIISGKMSCVVSRIALFYAVNLIMVSWIFCILSGRPLGERYGRPASRAGSTSC